MFANRNRLSSFQVFVIVVSTLVFTQLITNVWNIINYAVDDKIYEDGSYKRLYLGSLIIRLLWSIPMLYILKSLKDYYQILTNKKCCDDSIETIMLGYILLNVVPNLMFDCFNIGNYIYDVDMEIYKVQGPYTVIAMIAPLLFGILFVFLTMCIERYRYQRLSTSEL